MKSRTSGLYVTFFSLLCPSVFLTSNLSQNKKVTIVHNSPQLLNGAYPAKYRAAAERSVRERGIDLVLNDQVSDIPPEGRPVDGKVTTKHGKVLKADYVVR